MQVAVQSYLKAIGITADIKSLPGPAIQDVRTNSGWDGLMTGQLLTIAGMDPGALMKNMGFVNRGIWYTSMERTDDTVQLMDKANAEVDRDKRAVMLKEMNRLVMEKYAMMLPIYYTQGITATPPYVKDLGIGEYRYRYENAWLNK
jgi:ABC-type transport system substrate-binding protein